MNDIPYVDDEQVAKYIVEQLQKDGISTTHDFILHVLALELEYLQLIGVAYERQS